MKFSQYFLWARLIPAVLCAFPFFVLYYYYLNAYLGPLFEEFLKIKWIGDVSVSVAFIVFLAALGRAISKDIIEALWFKSDETKMPTTRFILHSGTEYTTDFKKAIHAKIENDFGIKLLLPEQEFLEEQKARKLVAEAVGLIRQKVKDGRLVLQHNIEYGFVRNLAGCSIVAVLISVLNIVVFRSISPTTKGLSVSIGTLTLYLILTLLGTLAMWKHGSRYARVLIREYMAT